MNGQQRNRRIFLNAVKMTGTLIPSAASALPQAHEPSHLAAT
jgi:hypothetical protein